MVFVQWLEKVSTNLHFPKISSATLYDKGSSYGVIVYPKLGHHPSIQLPMQSKKTLQETNLDQTAVRYSLFLEKRSSDNFWLIEVLTEV